MQKVSLVSALFLIVFSSCQKECPVPSHNPTCDVDTTIVSYSYYPSASQWATLSFEDNWPKIDDYDMNDLVLSYHYSFAKNKAGEIVKIFADYTALASGASYHNGFGVEFPFSPSLVKSVTGQLLSSNYIQQNANGTEAGQQNTVIIPFDNHENILHYSDYSYFINVYEKKQRITGDTAHVVLIFKNPVTNASLGNAPFNPFLISNMRRGYEIHLAGGNPTSKADVSLFNTDDDNSKNGSNYTSKNKMSWALNFVNGNFAYPIEKQNINAAYLHYANWIASGGKDYTDWYSNKGSGYRDNQKIYQ